MSCINCNNFKQKLKFSQKWWNQFGTWNSSSDWMSREVTLGTQTLGQRLWPRDWVRMSAWAFLAITSGTVPSFCVLIEILISHKILKKLELDGIRTAIKFFPGGVPRKFENGIRENFRFSAQAQKFWVKTKKLPQGNDWESQN